MKIKYFLAASAAALIAVTSANAADIVQPAPYEPAPVATVPTFSWAGVYAGGQIGGSWSKTKTPKTADGFWNLKPSGFIGGLYAGYNFDLGNNIVLGAETDFLWGNVKKYAVAATNEYKSSVEIKQKWAGATRVRAGYTIDRFMPYLAAGVAYTNVNVASKMTELSTSGDVDIIDDSRAKTFTGWTIGTGVDYAVTDNVLLRLEYRYTDYGSKKYSSIDIYGNTEIDKVKYKSNDIRVGVAYNF